MEFQGDPPRLNAPPRAGSIAYSAATLIGPSLYCSAASFQALPSRTCSSRPSFWRRMGTHDVQADCVDSFYHSATEPSSWKTLAIGFVPPNGYFARLASLNSKPSPSRLGSGKRPSAIRMAGNPNHSSQILSCLDGVTPPQISWIRKFGMAESTCSVARPPIGPSQACGAMEIQTRLEVGEGFDGGRWRRELWGKPGPVE